MSEDKYELIVSYIIDNQDKFYRLAYSYVHTKDDALDVVQNAICKALENYESLKNIAAIKTWFYRIVVNESITYIKKNNKEIYSDTIELIMDEEQSKRIDSEHEEEILDTENISNAIEKLPIDMQTIIKLHFFDGLTLTEVAEITGINVNSVKTKLYRCLKRLKVDMKEVLLYG